MGSMLTEKGSVGPREGIAYVDRFLEGGRIKAWGHRLVGGYMGSYSIGGSTIIPPLTSLLPISEGGRGGGVGGEGKVGGG